MSSTVTNQFTYIKKLDIIANVNVEAISNFSRIIKENVIYSHEKLQQNARDILFLKLTIHGQSTLFTTIRHLEFTLLRFTQQIDEFINAVQYMITGNLPLSSVRPPTLLNILKNILLHLPEGY
jgi:predicted glycosyltransferase involved in capsule biosynthesis